jgi:DNA-binding transcriptional regulator YhcF (GntR family)
MPFKIKIDKKSPIPASRQITERISDGIASGELSPGQKLPTERGLAGSLGVARGTVTRAYEELRRAGRLEVVQGRGSFVSARAGLPAKGRGEKAGSLIGSLIDGLADLRFTHPEMRTMIDLAIREREERHGSLAVAAVDCNPETLGMFERQIGLLSRVSVRKYLLADLVRDPDAGKRLAGFDLILTTSTHYGELSALAPGARDKIAQVAVAPSQETVLRLAAVKPDTAIGVMCESKQFLSIIEGKLREMRITGPIAALFPPRVAGALSTFLRGRGLLVVPPGYAAGLTREEARALEAFTHGGGTIVPFDYQIERGSLVYVEKRIGELLE